MAKLKRMLSGGAKDAYLARIAREEGAGDAGVVERILARLQDEIALVSLRRAADAGAGRRRGGATAVSTHAQSDVSGGTAPADVEAAGVEPAWNGADDGAEPQLPAAFDPYSPNVVVVFRTRGREAVLEELTSIDDVASLRLLAREQQLGIANDLDEAADIRLAIVAAAERRIANRRAAAS
jgi:hypothetical protein